MKRNGQYGMYCRSRARMIKVNKDGKEKLSRMFGCTERMVYNALSYESDTELARRIRLVARRDMGGWIEANVPEDEILYDVTEDGRHLMRQYYENGAVLEVDMDSGRGRVLHKGREMVTRENVLVRELPALQDAARAMEGRRGSH